MILLPGGDEEFNARLALKLEHLGAAAIRIDEPRGGPSTSGIVVCARIQALDPPDPLTIVAPHLASIYLPSVARAMLTAHRRVSAYVLIDPDSDPTDHMWPDAPVWLLHSSDPDPHMRLRGWEIVKASSAEACGEELMRLSAEI